MAGAGLWTLKNGELINKNANNIIHKALTVNAQEGIEEYPKYFWNLYNDNNLKNTFSVDEFHKAMTNREEVVNSYPKKCYFLKTPTNLKTVFHIDYDEFHKAMTAQDSFNHILEHPKYFWRIYQEDNKKYLVTGMSNIHPFKAMTKLNEIVNEYPKYFWSNAEYYLYDKSLQRGLNKNPELLGAFCHDKVLDQVNIINNITFDKLTFREASKESINQHLTVKRLVGKVMNYQQYTFPDDVEIQLVDEI